MAGITDIRFLTRPIQGYDVGGLVQFIPPELRAHAGAITTGIKAVADSMRISNPRDITKFGKEVIKAIRAGQIAPTVTAIGNLGTAIASSALDILPGGTQAKAVAKTGSKAVSKILDPSIPRELLHPAYKKTLKRYFPHPISAAGKLSRRQKKVSTVVDDFTILKDKMESGALTLSEIIDPLKKKARGTKHYQMIGKFKKYADDIKDIDPTLHNFFAREIDNYKLGKVSTKKIQKGPEDLEKFRKKLSKETGIPIKDLQRAHSTMQQRYIKINKLYDEGKITKAEFQELRKPQYLLLNPENQAHRTLENTLDALLDRRFQQSQLEQLDKLSITNKRIDKLINKMEGMKVESTLWDPSEMKLKTFGAQPGEEGLKYRFIKRKPRKTQEEILYIKKMKDRMKEEGLKLNTGGLVGISHLTRPI